MNKRRNTFFLTTVLAFLLLCAPASADLLDESAAEEHFGTCLDLSEEFQGDDDIFEKCAATYQAYQRALGMFNLQKSLLDLALRSGGMTQQEYNTALAALEAVLAPFRNAYLRCRNEIIARICLHLLF